MRRWLRLLRAVQWTKNAVVFAALVFGRPTDPTALRATLLAFIAFCAMSSSTYILNDMVDRDLDRVHPRKRTRPIAAGDVSLRTAGLIALGLAGVALVLGAAVNWQLLIVLSLYAALMVAYSLRLKRVPVLELMVIAVGFYLRALAGAVAVGVPVSPWLLVSTILLALLLAVGKRRSEVMRLRGNAVAHRPVLREYDVAHLNRAIVVIAALTCGVYAAYTLLSASLPGNRLMTLTVPLVVVAISRYVQLVFRRDEGGAPELLIWRDLPLLLLVAGWGVMTLLILASAGPIG